jgi:hypothetical protein
MPRYLVVANQTLGGEHLAEKVGACMAAGDAQFHILVPATHPHDHLTWTEGQAQALAQQRLDEALARFRELGATADGEVGDESPLRAIGDVLRRESFDEIILSTLPLGASRWLKQDLPHRVVRSFNLPVTHIVAIAETASS